MNLEMVLARLLGGLGLPGVQLTWTGDPPRIRKFLPEDALLGLVINGRLPDETEVRRWLRGAYPGNPIKSSPNLHQIFTGYVLD